jgi:hypothetical protein
MSAKRRGGPTRQRIARYWSLDAAKERGEAGFQWDDGEPRCWACSVYCAEFDGHTDAKGRTDAYDLADWLEKAHLVAHAVDGSTDLSNLVLLCHDCHRGMDRELGANRDRKAAIAWIRGYSKRWAEAFLSALDSIRGARERARWWTRTLREESNHDQRHRLIDVYFDVLEYEAVNTDGGLYSPYAAAAAMSRAIKTVQRWAKRSLALPTSEHRPESFADTMRQWRAGEDDR